jgi:hypothetical protein
MGRSYAYYVVAGTREPHGGTIRTSPRSLVSRCRRRLRLRWRCPLDQRNPVIRLPALTIPHSADSGHSRLRLETTEFNLGLPFATMLAKRLANRPSDQSGAPRRGVSLAIDAPRRVSGARF